MGFFSKGWMTPALAKKGTPRGVESGPLQSFPTPTGYGKIPNNIGCLSLYTPPGTDHKGPRIPIEYIIISGGYGRIPGGFLMQAPGVGMDFS